MIDKESQTVSATRYKAVELHHQCKPKRISICHFKICNNFISKFVSNHTIYSATDIYARVSVKPASQDYYII